MRDRDPTRAALEGAFREFDEKLLSGEKLSKADRDRHNDLWEQLLATLPKSQRERIENLGRIFVLGLQAGNSELLHELINFEAVEQTRVRQARSKGGMASREKRRAKSPAAKVRRRFDELDAAGVPRGAAVIQLVEEYERSERTIERYLKKTTDKC